MRYSLNAIIDTYPEVFSIQHRLNLNRTHRGYNWAAENKSRERKVEQIYIYR